MAATMAKKRAPKGSGRSGIPRTIYLQPELQDALDRYIASLRPSPSYTGVAAAALEDFLRARGFWPPPQASEPQDEGTEDDKPARKKKGGAS